MPKVEIYVQPTEGGDYDRLDMFDDENINVKLKLKDLTDTARIFSTYSQQFSVPASDKNNRLLNYFFNIDVVRNSRRYVPAKIYVNKELFKIGFLSINDGKYKLNRLSSYSVNFFTSLTNLKEIIKDDVLTSILPIKLFNWTDGNVISHITTIGSSSGDIIVPLASTRRVWDYNGTGLNSIQFVSSGSNIRYIDKEELRPAVKFDNILDLIFQYYQIELDKSEVDASFTENLMLYCNGNVNTQEIRFVGDYGDGWSSGLTNWEVDFDAVGDKFIFEYNGGSSLKNVSLRIRLNNVEPSISTKDDLVINYKMMDARPGALSGSVLADGTLNKSGNEYINYINFKNTSFGGITNANPLIVQIILQANTPIEFTSANLRFAVKTLIGSEDEASQMDMDAASKPSYSGLDVYKALPEIKVIDFLTSYFKMFNIKIIEDNANNTKIKLVSGNNFYTGDILDLTETIDINELQVIPNTLYKTYILTHNASEFRSNNDYKTANINNPNSKEFGQLIYTSTERFLKESYEVKTNFSITPIVFVPNTTINTFYGFNKDKPETLSNTTLEYDDNSKDLLLFYYNGVRGIYRDDSITGSAQVGIMSGSIAVPITTYNKVSIVNNDDETLYTNSLGFKDEVDINDKSFVYDLNLFSNFYAIDINRIHNPNTRIFTYNGYFSAPIIKQLNLRDTILIGDTTFSIEESDIDITTGKSKLLLMNYSPTYPSITVTDSEPPTAPTYFVSEIL